MQKTQSNNETPKKGPISFSNATIWAIGIFGSFVVFLATRDTNGDIRGAIFWSIFAFWPSVILGAIIIAGWEGLRSPYDPNAKKWAKQDAAVYSAVILSLLIATVAFLWWESDGYWVIFFFNGGFHVIAFIVPLLWFFLGQVLGNSQGAPREVQGNQPTKPTSDGK